MPGAVRIGRPLTTTDADVPAVDVTSVDTPVGEAQVVVELPRATVRALLVVGHGAGGDIEAPDLLVLRGAALRSGIAVARVRQPYRVVGRRAPAPAGQLDAAWLAVLAALRDPAGPFARYERRLRNRPVMVAGRSSGARVACRTAADAGAAGVVACAFPLHPPGRPDRSRAAELMIEQPLIVVQGSRDAFGRPADFPAGVRVLAVEGSDHALKSAAFEAVAAQAVGWILDVAATAGRD